MVKCFLKPEELSPLPASSNLSNGLEKDTMRLCGVFMIEVNYLIPYIPRLEMHIVPP